VSWVKYEMIISTRSCGSQVVWGGRAVGNGLILILFLNQRLFRHQSWSARRAITVVASLTSAVIKKEKGYELTC